MKKFETKKELVEWIEDMHLQNTNGRETENEIFRLGIEAAIEELKDLKLLNLGSVMNRFADGCKCENVEPQSENCYSQMIVVDIPPHMAEYRYNRVHSELSDKICIDPCIYFEIEYLWGKGIITYGSCCGHNKGESFVNVDARNIAQMLEMGYKQNHTDKSRLDTFRLKSA